MLEMGDVFSEGSEDGFIDGGGVGDVGAHVGTHVGTDVESFTARDDMRTFELCVRVLTSRALCPRP